MKNSIDINRIFSDGKLIDQALRAGVHEALLRHKQLGLPVVDIQNGRIVLIPPQKIDRLLKESSDKEEFATADRRPRKTRRR